MASESIQLLKRSPHENPVLSEIVRRLVDVYRPERIYLFGSAARGESGPDSDFDVMVVVSDSALPELRRSRPSYKALRGIGFPIDVLVRTRAEFEKRLHLQASLPSTVVREGKLLYAA